MDSERSGRPGAPAWEPAPGLLVTYNAPEPLVSAGVMDVITCSGTGDIKLYLSSVGPTGRGDPGTDARWIATLFAFGLNNDDCIDMAVGRISSSGSSSEFVAVGRGGVVVRNGNCVPTQRLRPPTAH